MGRNVDDVNAIAILRSAAFQVWQKDYRAWRALADAIRHLKEDDR